jgi:poly(A) polymerase
MDKGSDNNSYTVRKMDLTGAFMVPPPEDVSLDHCVIECAIPQEPLDMDALKIIRRLQRHGHQAYLVGGCVRDILLGQQPKDFDVVTSANPQDIRKLFRNSRLIGRRFRLIHMYFKQGKIIEVATFRRSATQEDELDERHAETNLYGGPADDVIRRDFTINALMYDPERQEIHDYVNGFKHLSNRQLFTIGRPERRLSEDPVRIIRAIRFAVRHDLEIGSSLLAAMRHQSASILECNRDRLTEEIFKVLRCGAAAPCLEMFRKLGILQHLFPDLRLQTAEETSPFMFMERMDQSIRGNEFFNDSIILAVFLFSFCREIIYSKGDIVKDLNEALAAANANLRFPRWQLHHIRQMFISQRRLLRGPYTRRAQRILSHDYAADAITLMGLVAEDGHARKMHEAWSKLISDKSQTRHRKRKPRRKRNQ